MSHPVLRYSCLSVSIEKDELRQRRLDETSRLLGSTITILDEAWQQPCALPGWTRAHLASHLIIGAQNLLYLIESIKAGRQARWWPTSLQSLERGSERSALELQIDLDTSCGRVDAALDELNDLAANLTFIDEYGFEADVSFLPLLRLNEIMLHHVDLRCGFNVEDIDQHSARWLSELNILRHGKQLPSAHLESESGLMADVGPQTVSPPHIFAPDNILLGWITGRLQPETIEKFDLPTQPEVL